MKHEDIIQKYADPGTRRVIRNTAFYARQERNQFRRHKRGLRRVSAFLAAIFGYEYIVVLYFLVDALQGLDTLVMAPVLALIVPLAAFAFHLRITHDTPTTLRSRLRAFVTVALFVLPIALSLGLALTLAQSIVFGGGSSDGGTVGGTTVTLGAPDTGFAQGILDVLQELAPVLMLALAASLAISIYVGTFLFRKIEEHYLFLEQRTDRSPVVLELVGNFQAGYRDFERVDRKRAILLKNLPPIPEERFAEEVAFAVNGKIAQMRKDAAKHRPGAEGSNVFTESLEPVTPRPPEISTYQEATARLNRIKDNLRSHAIVATLGAAPPKEPPENA